ncbi:MAG: translation initiation factor IF-2 [Coriobacteriia bacterium]|nr:translation initiation factor IF-2 [Coriobacteriia bacterium]
MDAGALSQAADKQALETPAAISQNSNQNASDQAIASDTAPKAPDAQATVARQAPEPPSSTPVRFSSLLAQIEAENRRLADEAEIKAAEEAAALASRTSGRSNRNRNRNRRAKANEAAQTTEVAQASEALTANEASIAANAGQSSEIRLTISNNPNVATDSQQAVESRSSRSRKRLSDDNEDSERTRSRSRNNRRDDEGPLVISPIPLDYADYDDQLDKDEEDRYRKMAQAAEQFQRERVLAEARAAVEAASNEGEGRRRKRKERREAEAREKIELEAIEKGIDVELLSDDVIQVTTGVTVGELAEIMKVPANDIIKRLFMLGMMMTVTQTMSDDLVELIADDMERKVRIVSPEEEYAVSIVDMPADLQDRPPVITVMGHVDHGKTSLLDAIRSTGVVATEAGGITQHIGASVVNIKGRQITFIDTPGHEAFTAMRARGAKVTDVVVLVVAADDGVMPQTIEAISHANAAEVPIVVAINKIDRPDANLDRVRAELAEHGIISEEWGGQNLFVEVSAKEHIGIDDLLETILLQADYLELKANPKAIASGFVIEAKLDRGRGPVATVLVQRGTLHVGEMLVAGTAYGRVRALISPQGDNVSEAYPADPVEVLGLGSVPEAGDEFRVFTDERDARNLAEDRALRKRLISQQEESHITLEDLFARMEGGLSELNLVVKADVQGSIEALKDALDKMDQSEVNINVIHSAVGGITETDVTLATASDAIIIGFNVRPESKARLAAEREKVEIKTYRVIYQAIDDINAARIGMLKPDLVEEHTGLAEVREVYRVPRVGNIAGCFVDSGEINADDQVRVVRNGAIVFESKIASLRHYRDDVDIVRSGLECGIGIEDFQDIKVGDVIEGYRIREVARES